LRGQGLMVQLILPYVDVDLKYYDLGMENRDAVSLLGLARVRTESSQG
jgi:hypothetical protein